jgi:hypothetical protein
MTPVRRFREIMRDNGMEKLACLLVLVLMLTVPACAGREAVSPPAVFFPTIPRQGAYPDALLEGVLEVRSGCVSISAREGVWLALWPEGYAARIADGQLEVEDGDGQLVGREGEQIRVGGGEAPSQRWASGPIGMEIPERCSGVYWVVAP